jgi:hypothetical protein
MLGERLEKVVENAGSDLSAARAARELTSAMLDVIEHQVDRKLKSRDLLEPPE